MAAAFENCHSPNHRLYDAASYIPFWAQKENLAIYHGAEGKPFSDGMTHFDKWATYPQAGEWQKTEGMEGYATLFEKKYWDFFSKAHPANGASVTLSHGDFRGDNLFFTDTEECGWQLIDFQLTFKGPIPSDLAYATLRAYMPPVMEPDSSNATRALVRSHRCGCLGRLIHR